MEGNKIKEIPVESANSLGIVERAHQGLKAVIAKVELQDLLFTDFEFMALAVYCCNATLDPVGTVPMLEDFGVIPKPPRLTPAPNHLQRAKATQQARSVLESTFSARKVQSALKYKGPRGRERLDLMGSQPYSPVIVYRTKTGKWKPFKFI